MIGGYFTNLISKGCHFKLVCVILDTSRERNPGEEDGVDFFFENARKMQNGYQRNHFIEVCPCFTQEKSLGLV